MQFPTRTSYSSDNSYESRNNHSHSRDSSPVRESPVRDNSPSSPPSAPMKKFRAMPLSPGLTTYIKRKNRIEEKAKKEVISVLSKHGHGQIGLQKATQIAEHQKTVLDGITAKRTEKGGIIPRRLNFE